MSLTLGSWRRAGLTHGGGGLRVSLRTFSAHCSMPRKQNILCLGWGRTILSLRGIKGIAGCELKKYRGRHVC